MILTIRNGWVIAQRDLIHWIRRPAKPIFGLVFSIMILAMFAFLFGGAITVPGGGEYIDFLLPGMLVLTMLFGVEATMTATAEDLKRGITDRFRSMPIGGAAVSLGRSGADLVNSTLELVVLGAVGVAFGWALTADLASTLAAAGLLLWLRFALIWVGIFLGLALRGEGGVSAVQVLVWPLGFFSSVFVSPDTMPGWLAPVAEWNPISATAMAIRDLLHSPTGATSGFMADHAILFALGWPLVITAVFLPLSIRLFQRRR